MKRPHVVHHVPGRVRIRVPGGGQRLHDLAQQLSTVPGVESVRASPNTDSLVLHYDREAARALGPNPAEATAQLLHIAMPEEAEEAQTVERAIDTEAEYLARHSVTAREVVHFFRGVNAKLKVATDNTLDLQVLLPMALGVMSAVTARRPRPSPLWITLAMFSFNAFVSLHKVPQAGGRLTRD